MPRFCDVRRGMACAVFVMVLAPLAGAHTMTMTQVLVSFGKPDTVDVKIDIDLTLLLGSPERYYEVGTESPQKQRADIAQIVPRILDCLQLFVGQERLHLVF